MVVVRQEYAQKKELEACFRQLRLSNVRILGCVINDATQGNGYYSKYKYRRYYKYYKYYSKYYSHYGHYGKHKKGKKDKAPNAQEVQNQTENTGAVAEKNNQTQG